MISIKLHSNRPVGDPAWQGMRVCWNVSHHFEPFGQAPQTIYELILHSSPQSGQFPGADSQTGLLNTHDLFQEWPCSGSGTWRHCGRSDDVLLLSSGQNWNPRPMELQIEAVSSSCVFPSPPFTDFGIISLPLYNMQSFSDMHVLISACSSHPVVPAVPAPWQTDLKKEERKLYGPLWKLLMQSLRPMLASLASLSCWSQLRVSYLLTLRGQQSSLVLRSSRSLLLIRGLHCDRRLMYCSRTRSIPFTMGRSSTFFSISASTFVSHY